MPRSPEEPGLRGGSETIGWRGTHVKIFASVACLLFTGSAVVQLNDPDPIRWFSLYASAALLSATSMFVSVPGYLFVALASVAGIWAATLLPSVLSAASLTGTEDERELAGLALVTVASVVLWRSGARTRDVQADRPSSGGSA